MLVNFSGGAYETFSKNLNAQECVNFYVHVDQEAGTSQLSLRGTPGLKEWVDTGYPHEVRGIHKFDTYLYAVVGNKVYRVSTDGVSVLCSGSLESLSGSVSMASIAATDTTSAQLMIVDGVSGYIVVDTTLTKITDATFFSNPKTVTSQDSYFIYSYFNSGWCYISSVGDGTVWDANDRFVAGGYPDNVLAVISDHRDVYALGEKTTEVFYNSGGDPPFTVRPGSTQEVGAGAKDSPAQLDNTFFFLSDKFQVVKFDGNNLVAKSTRSIDYQISQYETKSDAIGFAINIDGNAFYVLTFPTANKTWCYNAASNFWHQLTSYPGEGRWRGNCSEFFSGKNIVGDYGNGKLYEVDFDTYTDNSEPIRRIRTTSAVKNEGKNVFHHQLEIFFESGVGLITGQGSDPQAMLQYSDDGGHTWSSEIWRSAGKIGAYNGRAVWNRLGSSRHRNYRLIVTDPVKWVVTNANLEVTVGRT